MKKVRRMGQYAEKREPRKNNRSRKKNKRGDSYLNKWNQITALRFLTGVGGDIRHPRPPFGGKTHIERNKSERRQKE